MNQAPYLLPERPVRLPPRQRRARSTRPSTTACGARSRTATWAPTPSASRSRTTSAASDQDAFALASHQKAIAAIDAGRFDAEMAPVTVRDAKGRETVVDGRRGPAPRLDRRGARPAQAGLRPADGRGSRRRDRSAPSPPATRPGITDGAAATVVASERAVERLGLKPLARIVGYAQAEVAPKWLFLAPVEGVRRLLDRIELPIEAFDLIEINEAFAAQTLADGRELGFDWDEGQRQRRRDRARPPDRRERGADRRDAAPRARAARGPLRARDPVPRRRRLGRDGLRAGLSRAVGGPSARRSGRGHHRTASP